MPLARSLQRCLQGLLIASLLLLTGCLQYDLDVQFDSQTHGQLVQQVRWQGDAVASEGDLATWLQGLTARTEQVGGKLRRMGQDGLEIRIPFHNGHDLETRFNQFFAESEGLPSFTLPGGESIQAHLTIAQGNWLLAINNHLTLQIDLTQVPDLADLAFPLLQNTQILAGAVQFTTPWGVRSPLPAASPDHWPLTVGQMNTLEVDFWVPSPIGIGAACIALIIAIGYGVRYYLLPRRLS